MNKDYFDKYSVVVVDSGGGQVLEPLASIYINKDCTLFEARRLGYKMAKTKYVMNLDSDVLIPLYYPEIAILTLDEQPGVGAISLFYQEIGNRGTLEFGISIWRRNLLASLYDYGSGKGPGYCECNYLWEKLLKTGHRLLTMGMKAYHLNGEKK